MNMKNLVFAFTAGIGMSLLGLISSASAQVYYAPPLYGQLTWASPVVYQPPGVPIGGGVNYGNYWSPNLGNQAQGICVTCNRFGSWGGVGGGPTVWYGAGNDTSFNGGYYPNGYSYQVRDRRVINYGDDRIVRNRQQSIIFRPF